MRTSTSGNPMNRFKKPVLHVKTFSQSRKLLTRGKRFRLHHKVSILTNILILRGTTTTMITAMFQNHTVNCTKTKRLCLRATNAKQCAVKCVQTCIRAIQKHFSKINLLRPIIVRSCKLLKKLYSIWERSTPLEMFSLT